MPKTQTRKILALIAIVPLLSACLDLEDAAIGVAGIVIVDRVMEKQNGGDGLF